MSSGLTDPRRVVYALAHALLIVGGFLSINIDIPYSTQIGASLVAAGIAGMVVFAYVLVSDRRSQLVGILREFGFVDAFEGRASKIRPQYEKRLAKASDNIDVMGFGLSAMRQDFQKEFGVWSRKAKVRVLLMDPEFPPGDHPNARQRDLEENEDAGTIDNQVRAFVRATNELISGDTQFDVRLYRCLPSINIFRVDDELFWGPYLIGQHSRNMPTFVVKREGILFRKIVDHFEAIWSDERFSRPVPPEWLTEDQR